MKKNNQKINEAIDQVTKKWDFSGHFVLYKGTQTLHHKYYGYENREEGRKTDRNTRYLLDSYDRFFVKLAAIIAIDRKAFKWNDQVSKYIVDFKHGDQITVKHLLKENSGLFDFYHNHLMVEFENDPDHLKLKSEDRMIKENNILFQKRDFISVYDMIKDHPLEFEPGKKDEGSDTNAVILAEILKRTTGFTPFEYLKETVFDVLDMSSVTYGTSCDTLSYMEHQMDKLVKAPIDFEADGIFSVSVQDLTTFILALKDQQLFSKTLWQKVLKVNAEGDGILFNKANGYDAASTGFLGFGFHIYCDFDRDIAFASISNEEQLFERVDNAWRYFRRDSREIVSSHLMQPEHTKMVRLNKKNFWYGLELSIKEEQHEYVLDAKGSIAMGLFYKTKKAFVQMEGDTVVGLLVLDINKKKDDYSIDIIIIDQKYQNKGFGKWMVKWAVDYLKEAGAQKLSIGVNRENIATKKVYLNAGFKPNSVYSGGMELVMKL